MGGFICGFWVLSILTHTHVKRRSLHIAGPIASWKAYEGVQKGYITKICTESHYCNRGTVSEIDPLREATNFHLAHAEQAHIHLAR